MGGLTRLVATEIAPFRWSLSVDVRLFAEFEKAYRCGLHSARLNDFQRVQQAICRFLLQRRPLFRTLPPIQAERGGFYGTVLHSNSAWV